MAFVKLSGMPDPNTVRVSNIPTLSGGLNLHDSPWQMKENQSPELKNLWWKDGTLRSRPAQVDQPVQLGDETDSGCAVWPHLYKGYYIFHRGHQLFAVSEDLQRVTEISTDRLSYIDAEGDKVTGLPDSYGTFVLHNGILYYKTRGVYAVFVESATETGFAVRPIESFDPTILINADPAVPGAGDLYQPLNRLSPFFYVTYSPTEDETTDFYAPFHDCSIVDVEILDSSGAWVSIDHGRFNNVTRQTRGARITASAKSQIEAGHNNVRVLFSRSGYGDYTDQYEQILSCDIAAVYGGGEGLCMVLAGCESQPNAWFWSANTDLSMDPTYFPMEHFNLAGDFSDPITALGQQQNKLVIFQKSRIGGATFGTADIDGRTFITMDYATLHPYIGCDLPKSVQLIENNLVFANGKLGIFLLRDTTAAGENTIAHLSDNIERSADRDGLLRDLRESPCDPVSLDDGERYWLMVNGHAWLWDYRLGGSAGSPRSLSWFYFDGIHTPACVFGEETYVGCDGILRRFIEDGAEDFESLLTLPMRNFGTYEVRKNVTKIIFALDTPSEGEITVEYLCDHASHTDPTPLLCKTGEPGTFAEVFVRRPRCLGVRHFLCRLRSSGRMAFASAQMFYTYKGEER